MSTRGQVSENAGLGRCIRPIALSILIGTVCCVVLLLLMAALMTARSIPQFAVHPMAIFALAVGGCVAGLCCSRMMRENGLVYGALCGVALTVVVLLAGLALKDNGFGLPALLKIAVCMFSAMIGGVLGVNTRRRQSRGRK